MIKISIENLPEHFTWQLYLCRCNSISSTCQLVWPIQTLFENAVLEPGNQSAGTLWLGVFYIALYKSRTEKFKSIDYPICLIKKLEAELLSEGDAPNRLFVIPILFARLCLDCQKETSVKQSYATNSKSLSVWVFCFWSCWWIKWSSLNDLG